ncbi:hypothetical protein [Patulibacter minatonensis]|uniref:hypothetical protein n=1 Tax=Patulibacter minatonensis TaxID=298163 RepID=UPI00047CA8EA|nr:hypothetical protein [Patulibacter minatonensis]
MPARRPSPLLVATACAALTATVPVAIPTVAGAAPSTVHRCGTIAVPGTESRAAVSLRGTSLACRSVQRVVRTAYSRTVLLGATRVTVRDAGRTFRCVYTSRTGSMVCEGRGRRLRGTI